MDDPSLYNTDVVSWSQEQAVALRRLADAAPGNAVDWANVIEEIESVGRSEWNGVRSQLTNALDHLIRGVSDPNARSIEGWRAEIDAFLGDARSDFRRSMANQLDMEEIWQRAMRWAKASLTRYDAAVAPDLPELCPFSLDEVLSPSFDFDAGYRRLKGHPHPTGDAA